MTVNFQHIRKYFQYILSTIGFIFLLMAILAFTRIPFDVHRWLGEKASAYSFTPEIIIMLGGSGMPSESNLIRLYYTEHLSTLYPDAAIIIAHPTDRSVVQSMMEYLVKTGVDSSRISYMLKGTNTRQQALELLNFIKGIEEKKIVIVSSPENMYRTMKVFRKLNFLKTGGVPAFENAMFVDLKYSHKKVGGKQYAPDVSENIDLRYNFWNYLKLEITCLREFTALLYYKINGWI